MLKKSSFLFSLLLPISLFSWEIVDYKPEHREAIIEISFHDPELFFPGYKQCKQSPVFNKEMFSEAVTGSLDDALRSTLVIVEDGAVAGFVTFFKTREQCIKDFENLGLQSWSVEQLKAAIPGLKDTKEECEFFAKIESVAVSRDFRRRGFGKILLQTSLNHITSKWPELGYVVLVVVSDNNPAQALYEQSGFFPLEQNETQKMMQMFEYRKNLK